MSPVCKMADNGRLTVDQKVKVVLFYAETKSVVATQRSFSAHFGTRWAPCKQTIYRLSFGTIFQPMRINSVPDVECFCSNKNVLCVQSLVWYFVRHLVCRSAYLRSGVTCQPRHIQFQNERQFQPIKSVRRKNYTKKEYVEKEIFLVRRYQINEFLF